MLAPAAASPLPARARKHLAKLFRQVEAQSEEVWGTAARYP